jgi:hypothetical protein
LIAVNPQRRTTFAHMMNIDADGRPYTGNIEGSTTTVASAHKGVAPRTTASGSARAAS